MKNAIEYGDSGIYNVIPAYQGQRSIHISNNYDTVGQATRILISSPYPGPGGARKCYPGTLYPTAPETRDETLSRIGYTPSKLQPYGTGCWEMKPSEGNWAGGGGLGYYCAFEVESLVEGFPGLLILRENTSLKANFADYSKTALPPFGVMPDAFNATIPAGMSNQDAKDMVMNHFGLTPEKWPVTGIAQFGPVTVRMTSLQIAEAYNQAQDDCNYYQGGSRWTEDDMHGMCVQFHPGLNKGELMDLDKMEQMIDLIDSFYRDYDINHIDR